MVQEKEPNKVAKKYGEKIHHYKTINTGDSKGEKTLRHDKNKKQGTKKNDSRKILLFTNYLEYK